MHDDRNRVMMTASHKGTLFLRLIPKEFTYFRYKKYYTGIRVREAKLARLIPKEFTDFRYKKYYTGIRVREAKLARLIPKGFTFFIIN